MLTARPHRFVALLAATTIVAGAAFVAGVRAATPAVAEFFDDSQVQTIDFTINSRDWQSLKDHYLDNDYYPCDFKWRDQVVRNVGIRSRGTGSRSGAKPGLRVDFDRFTTKQTFLGTLKSFILRNQTQDASNMHERIGMLLYQRLGVPAVRETYARVYVNNTYSGLYTIVESPDKAYLDRIYGDKDGHLYKYDYNAGDSPWFFQSIGDDPAQYVPHPFKPETHEDDPQPEFVRNFIRIASTDSDAVWRSNLASYIDWENFAKHIAVEAFIADQDGFNGDYGVNNFYWYRWTNKNLFSWIAWDKSEAFKSAPTQNVFHNVLEGDPARRNRLSARAMTLDDVRNMYLDALLALAASAGERDPAAPDDTRGWMEREIDRDYQQIRDLVYADSEKPFTNEEFEQAVESLRTFARIRPGSVVTQVNTFRRQ